MQTVKVYRKDHFNLHVAFNAQVVQAQRRLLAQHGPEFLVAISEPKPGVDDKGAYLECHLDVIPAPAPVNTNLPS